MGEPEGMMGYLGSLVDCFLGSRQGILLYTCSIYLLLDRAGTTTTFYLDTPNIPFLQPFLLSRRHQSLTEEAVECLSTWGFFFTSSTT